MKNPETSIIMGVCNCCKSLSYSIDSILSQTYTDWEFIIYDDYSTDGSAEILKEYQKKYSQIKVLFGKSHHGLAYGLNVCLKFARGQFIARMDGDDYSHPKRLEVQINFLKKRHKYAFVGCDVNLFDENGIWGERNLPNKPTEKHLLWTTPFVHPTVVFRKECLIHVNGYRDIPKTLRCEDYDLWFRLYGFKYRGYNLSLKLFNYYQSKGSCKNRKYYYRLNESRVRLEGYKNLNLLPIGFLYAVKPLIVGLIPQNIIFKVKKSIYKDFYIKGKE